MKLEGLFTAIVTPFRKDGSLDEEGLQDNIEFQIKNKVDGLVPVGTTGESATLSEGEHKRVVEIAVEQVNGRVSVIAGTGSNNTTEAIKYTKHAKDAGADAALMITPYYNKPTQEGLYQHYKKIVETVDIPIILYTVPGRTAVNIEPETTRRLSELSNIIGIKDASGNLNQVSQEIMLCGKEFSVVSGEDAFNYPIIALGGRGAISVVSNVVPLMMGELVREALKGNHKKAKEMHYKLYALSKVLFIETNPSPVKAAMNMIGLAAGDPRLPLVPVKKESEEKIRKVLQDLDLL
ncbi:MAG: 4-hydroxy-tetrahydrodipicolinate synthase [Candidatus Altiarchaeota archaeon]|nr:4-hydroxy-tetrahydrodipicolinate synthase [Candidatus Altiarchaeota archaeon]